VEGRDEAAFATPHPNCVLCAVRGVFAAEALLICLCLAWNPVWALFDRAVFIVRRVAASLRAAAAAFFAATRLTFTLFFELRLWWVLLTEVEWFFFTDRDRRGAASEELTVPPITRAIISRLSDRRVRFLGPVKTSLPFVSAQAATRLSPHETANRPTGPVSV
jgi:hypothetical protein